MLESMWELAKPAMLLGLVAICAWPVLRVAVWLGRRLGEAVIGKLPQASDSMMQIESMASAAPPARPHRPVKAISGRIGMAERVEHSHDSKYWLELNPFLSIESESEPAAPDSSLTPEQMESIAQSLRRSGYFQFDGAIPEDVAAKLANAISRLVAYGWAPVFVFVYDEAWLAFRRMRRLLEEVLGSEYRQLPEFWAWRLDPELEEEGWKPHRDKGSDALLIDGRPKSLTAWIALTHADRRNGCLHVLPADRDPNYGAERASVDLRDHHDVQALPVSAGSLLGWNGALLHWSGRATTDAETPRISMSFEFQRGDAKPFSEPLLDPNRIPPFAFRLKLIALQILQYRHMHSLPEEQIELARAVEA